LTDGLGLKQAWNFRVMFYPLQRPIEMAPGDTLKVCGAHGRLSLRIWTEVPEVQ